MDLGNPSVQLPEIHIESSLVQNLIAGLETTGKEWKIRVNGKQTGLISSAKAIKLIPSGWRISGQDSLSIAATLDEKGAWRLDSRMSFQKLSFQDPSDRYMGENIHMDLGINGALNLKNTSISGTISVKITNGEVLYDLFYLNLNENVFFSSGNGTYDRETKRFDISNLKLGYFLFL